MIKNGKVNFVGVKRNNDTISQIEIHQNVFEIGSLTKVFTATILSNLVLDDNINDYIEVLIKNNLKISFKQLANHTSLLVYLKCHRILNSLTGEINLKNTIL